MTTKHVLVVDDDPAMRTMIADYLVDRGFRATTAADGRGMREALAGATLDLVVLDLKLGSEDGLQLIRELRGGSAVPVIIVTGHRRDEVDRVVGLELGADGYLTKPFGLRELLARVHAVPRRSAATTSLRPEAVGRRVRYRFAGWDLDPRARRLTSPDDQVVPLTHVPLSGGAGFRGIDFPPTRVPP